jgi:hypothetical protein
MKDRKPKNKDLAKDALEKSLEEGLEESDEIVKLFIEKYGDPGDWTDNP